MSQTLLRKAFPAEVKILDEAQRIAEFVISTDRIDRYGDVIEVDGWDVKDYMANPVVQWAHDYGRPPVAKALSVRTEYTAQKNYLVAVDQFADPAILEGDLKSVWPLYQAGFLNATSVGFIPIAWTLEQREDEDGYKGFGYRYTSQELIEHSMVPIPANPDALGRAKAAGIDVPESWMGDGWRARMAEGAHLTRGPREYVVRTRPEETEEQRFARDLREFIAKHENAPKYIQSAHDALLKAGATCVAADEVETESIELDTDIDMTAEELVDAVQQGTKAAMAQLLGRVD